MRWTACGPKVGTEDREERKILNFAVTSFHHSSAFYFSFFSLPLFYLNYSFLFSSMLEFWHCQESWKQKEWTSEQKRCIVVLHNSIHNRRKNRRETSDSLFTFRRLWMKMTVLYHLVTSWSKREWNPFFPFILFLFPLVSLSLSSPFWFKKVWLGWKRGDREDSLHLAQGSGYIFHVDFFILSCHPVLL